VVALAVEMNAINPFDFFIDDRARKVARYYGRAPASAVWPRSNCMMRSRGWG